MKLYQILKSLKLGPFARRCHPPNGGLKMLGAGRAKKRRRRRRRRTGGGIGAILGSLAAPIIIDAVSGILGVEKCRPLNDLQIRV